MTRQVSPTRREVMQTSADTLLGTQLAWGQGERFPWHPPKGVPDAAKRGRCWREAGEEECGVTGEVWGLSAGSAQPGPSFLILLRLCIEQSVAEEAQEQSPAQGLAPNISRWLPSLPWERRRWDQRGLGWGLLVASKCAL